MYNFFIIIASFNISALVLFWNCRGKKSVEKKKRRRKQEDGAAADGDDNDDESSVESDDEDMDVGDDENKRLTSDSEDVTNSAIKPTSSNTEMETEESGQREAIEENGDSVQGSNSVAMETEEVFKVTIGPQSAESEGGSNGDKVVIKDPINIFMPPPRMNALMAVKNNQLFLYGGIFEVGDKQFTLSDMYSLDVSKMEEWTTIVACDLKAQVSTGITIL